MRIPFVVQAGEAERMRAESGLEMQDFLATLVDPTRALARSPISRFRVGAVGLGSSGRLFRGVNLEFPGLPLHHSVHAEQFMVANMAQNGEVKLERFAVSAAPCGHCRQFLQELRGALDVEVLIVDEKNCECQMLSKFLPHRFGPDDLLAQNLDFPLLLEPRNNGLSFDHSHNSGMNGFTEPAEFRTLYAGSSPTLQEDQKIYKRHLPALRDAAMEAANRSYAPYTDCPSGIAILSKQSDIFAGSYCESAAYNPSLPPLQAAIVAFVANGGGKYEEIDCAVLVEKQGAPVQQAASARMLLDQISPLCPLYVYHAK